MPKKRSLKDAASAPLVAKSEIRLAGTTSLPGPAVRVPAPRKTSRLKQVSPAVSSPQRPSEATPVSVAKRTACGSLVHIAVLILIGFVGGVFFGRFIKLI